MGVPEASFTSQKKINIICFDFFPYELSDFDAF